MRRFIWALIMIPAAAVVVVFALHNKASLALDLWPFGIVLEMPTYLVLFFALGAGIVLGGIAAWLGQGRMRASLRDQVYDGEVAKRELRSEREKSEKLQAELDTLKTPQQTTPSQEVVPVQGTETLPPQNAA